MSPLEFQGEPRRSGRLWGWFLLAALAVAAGACVYVVRARTAAPPQPEGPAIVTHAPVSAPAGLAGATGVVAQLVSVAEDMERSDEPTGAREKYLEARTNALDPAALREIDSRIGRLSIQLIMSPAMMPEKTNYTVRAGDLAARIVQRFGTTLQLLQKSNNIQNPDLLRPGDRLRVCTGRFSIDVDKGRYEVVLSLNGRFFKRYACGTGRYGKTPVGAFVISDRVAQPTWWRPDGKAIPYGDPENILGTHWLNLRSSGGGEDIRGYGIHGTWASNSIGKAESGGCVRLRNEDVEEIYTIVPNGTPVTIRE